MYEVQNYYFTVTQYHDNNLTKPSKRWMTNSIEAAQKIIRELGLKYYSLERIFVVV